MEHKTNGPTGGPRGGGTSHAPDAIPPTKRSLKKIFNKKGEEIGSFTEVDLEREKREEQDWLKQGDLTSDGREAAYDEQNDEGLCRKLTGKFARESARRTSRKIGEIRDRYETIVLEFLAAHYGRPDENRVSLATVLRSKYETDEALGRFLPALGRWLNAYVVVADAEGRAKGSWTMSGYAVSADLLNVLAEEYKRDSKGLMRFLKAVFTHWREIFEAQSRHRVRLLTHQMKSRRVKDFAEYLQEIGAVPKCAKAKQLESLHARIKQYRKRDREKALEQKAW